MFIVWIVPCALARNVGTMLVARFLGGVAGSAFLSVCGRDGGGHVYAEPAVDADDGIHGRAVRRVSRRSLSAAKGGGQMKSPGRAFMACIISSGVPCLSLVGLDFEDGLGYAGVCGQLRDRLELGPLMGGFINQYASWRWSVWALMSWEGAQLALIVLFVPKTYHRVLLREKARPCASQRGTRGGKRRSRSCRGPSSGRYCCPANGRICCYS